MQSTNSLLNLSCRNAYCLPYSLAYTPELSLQLTPGKTPSGRMGTFPNTAATFKGMSRKGLLLQETQVRTDVTSSYHMEVLVGMLTRWGAVSKVTGIMSSLAEDHMLSACCCC